MSASKLDKMVAGYRAGLTSDQMEPSDYAKRVHGAAWIHGWFSGRDDRIGQPRDKASVLRRRADMILGDAPNAD